MTSAQRTPVWLPHSCGTKIPGDVLLRGRFENAQTRAFAAVHIVFVRAVAVIADLIVVRVHLEQHAEFRHIAQPFDWVVIQRHIDLSARVHGVGQRRLTVWLGAQAVDIADGDRTVRVFCRDGMRVQPASSGVAFVAAYIEAIFHWA